MRANPGREMPRAFHVIDDFRTGITRKHVRGEQHQLTIGIDDAPVPRHHAKPVAVAIKREPEFGAVLLDCGYQIDQIFRTRRIRVMVRKGSVDLGVQLDHLASEPSVQLTRGGTGHAVAAVDRDFHRTSEAYAAHDAREIRLDHVLRAQAATARCEPALFDAPAKVLDILARERHALHHHLESVVVGRVVAAGDCHRTAATELVRGEVGNRRRPHADVHDIRTGRTKTLDQSGGQTRPREPPVATHRERRPPALARVRTERTTDQAHRVFGERLVDDATDVIGLENFSCGLCHGRVRRNCEGRKDGVRRTPARSRETVNRIAEVADYTTR